MTHNVGLQASPQQRRCGVVVRSAGSLRLNAVVLPKPWRVGEQWDRSGAFELDWPGASLDIVLHEGDSAVITCLGEDASIKASLLFALARRPSEPDGGDTLFRLTSSVRTKLPAEPVREGAVRAIVDLFRLCEIAEFDPFDQDAGALDLLPVQHEWLLVMLEGRFLRNLQSVLVQARKGYTEHREYLSTLRGRLRLPSLAVALESGTPRVECEYGELEYDTPLLRTLATCLKAIASRPLTADQGLRRKMEFNRNWAINLQRRMRHVPVVPAAVALLHARRARLSRLDEAWRPALNLAVPVLLRQASAGQESGSGFHGADALLAAGSDASVRIEIPTAVVWEGLVRRCVTGRFSGATMECHPPWAGMVKPPRPDIVVTTEDGPLVVDAKYKAFPAEPTAQDAYQMFAYSHLIFGDGGHSGVQELVLAYVADRRERLQWTMQRNPDAAARRRPRLRGVGLPWPSRHNLTASEQYLRELSAAWT